MKCPYVYRDGDAAVKDGRVPVGHICGSNYGMQKYGGLCIVHARLMNMVPREQTIAQQEKTKATKRRSRQIAFDEAIKKINSPGPAERELLNETVLDSMGLKDPCDLATEYKLFKALNEKPTYEKYDEKMAFARWLESPVHLRTPQTLEEVAEILGVSVPTLKSWKTTPEIIDFINLDVRNRIDGLYKLAIYKLGVNIDRGDIRSIETFLKYYEEKRGEKNKKKKSMNLPPELQKEADDFARALGERNRRTALKSESSMVLEQHFLKDEDIEQ